MFFIIIYLFYYLYNFLIRRTVKIAYKKNKNNTFYGMDVVNKNTVSLITLCGIR
jgi:hypothetical protein